MIHDAFGPKPYQLIYGSTGKPHVLMPYERHIEVSLSHSNGFAAAGVTSAGRLGVDIESFGKTLALKELEPLALSDRERTEFAHSVGHDRTDDVFLRRWTLKEAIVKATGQGLAAGFQNFAVSILPPGLLTRAPDGSPSAEWQLDVTSVNGGILAVALHQATTQSFPFDVEEYVFPGDGR
jgi:4'-phosphopantetheinyl transferase